ncbi:MAG: MBL fold metallo-hydrolase [Oscillospiraceae bacterium]
MKSYHLMGRAPYYTNCFLLVDNSGSAVLIDCSVPWQKLDEILKNDHAQLKAILMTHGHHDHRETLDEVRLKSGAPVYLGRQDAQQFNIEKTIGYSEHETLEFGEIKLFVFHTPGHTPGGYCLRCEDMLFSGDTLFAGTIGRTDLLGGDYEELMTSLKTMAEYVKNQNPKVLPGHAHFSTFDMEKQQNPYLKEIAKCL